MKLNDLDQTMRIYETAHDHHVLPHLFMIARLNGRCFNRLTKETHAFKTSYDLSFRDNMTQTLEHLIGCGFKVVYGYTQRDEISLLLDIADTTFERKERKINTILAGEASAKLSLLLGDVSVFDCRLSQLPARHLVIDYFRWRQTHARRNTLNSYCYWSLRKEGKTPKQIDYELSGLSLQDKEILLTQLGINFNTLPQWEKRGIGAYWETYQKPATNKKTGEAVLATRRRIKIDYHLPIKEDYQIFIDHLFC